MDRIIQLLNEAGAGFSQLSTGELFVRRPDGRGMHIRSYEDGKCDWCIGQPHNDTNYMDMRKPTKQSTDDALTAVREFLNEAS